jgi:hypothetical protein
MSTDSSGLTTVAKAEISAGGIVPIGFIKTAGNVIFIPYFDEAYDLWLFPTEAEADANDTSNAIQVADNVDFLVNIGKAVTIESEAIEIVFDTVADMISGTLPGGESITLAVGQTVKTKGYLAEGDGGDNTYEIVAAATGTDDGGSFIDLNVLQAKALFPKGIYNVRQWGAVGDGSTDDSAAINAAFVYANANSVPFVDITGVHAIAAPIFRLSNVTVRCTGKIIINADIPAASNSGAIICDNKTNSKWIGGAVDVTYASYDNNVFLTQDSNGCLLRDVDILDGGVDRYPLGPIRSRNNSRCRTLFCDISNVQGIAMQSFNDNDCHTDFITTDGPTSTRTMIETNEGDHNTYIGNDAYCPTNTGVSALSFNDSNSVLLGCKTKGGAFGVTVGDVAPDEANYSVVLGNVIDEPDSVGLNVQATQYAAIVGNTVKGGATGGQGTSGSNNCAYVGNVHAAPSSVGVRSGEFWTVVGNVVDGDGQAFIGYRAHVDGDHAVFAGNSGLNCINAIYGWGIAGQENATLVGNFAGDNQGVPTSLRGFWSSNGNMQMLGNSTDGNFTSSEQTGPYSAKAFKDLSATAEFQVAESNGGTTAAAAATGAVNLTIDGTTYQILFK